MRRLVLVLATAVALAGVNAGAAWADSNSSAGQTGNGYSAQATTAHLSGPAAPGGGGGVSVSVPATCWWAPDRLSKPDGSGYFDPSDSKAWVDWYDWAWKNNNGTFAPGNLAFGDKKMWEDAAKAAKDGKDISVYSAQCRSGAPECALAKFTGVAKHDDGTEWKIPGWGDCGFALTVRFFEAGQVPPPMVDPEDLAKAARDAMVLPKPTVDRNPKASGTGYTQATIVNLPTWFWVTDPDAVGGTTGGKRTIRADAGTAWAEVTAENKGLTVTSPAGGKDCTWEQAATKYAKGVDDSQACTVEFERASVGYDGGYPVDTSTSWSASWTGSGGTGGKFPSPLIRTATVNVPVAESQALVSSGR